MSLLHETLTHEDIDLLWELRQKYPYATLRDLKRKLIVAQEAKRSQVRHDAPIDWTGGFDGQ